MKKVFNVISDSNIGGAGRMLLAFLKNYDRKGLEITVVVPEGAKLIKELERLNTRYLTIEGLAEKSFDLSAVKIMKKIFISEKPDIVHAHASMSARIAARGAGCKVVYTRHSVFPNSRLKTSFPLRQVYGAINNYYADRVIAVSPAAKDLLIEAGQNPKKVSVIYNGVDSLTRLPTEQRQRLREAYGISADDFVCGIFARLTPVKGHEYVLNAARQLAEEKDIKFIIAGTGEIEDNLKESAGNINNVIFTGFLDNVEEMMGVIDLQLNASYGTEATSLSLLEGMSIGIPAVASSFGGNPYVISDGENGLIFPEKDAKALAERIKRVYSNRELYMQLSKNAERIFAERFTSAKMTDELEALYFSL